MSTFLYNGKDENDKKLTGIIDATDSATATKKVQALGVVDCDLFETMTSSKAKVGYGELAVFSKQLATLYRTNISLVEGLILLKDQTPNKQLQITILEIHKLIHEGYTLANAVAMYPHIFGKYFIKIISIAEVSGTLEYSLGELYKFYRDGDKIGRKIKNILIYPTILTTMLMVIVGFVVIKVMPIFNDLLVAYGIEMPNLTRKVVNSTIWISNNFILVTIGIIAIITSLVFYFKSTKGNIVLKKMLHKIKLFRNVETRILAISYSKSVASLLKSGMILSKSIELSNTLVEDTMFSSNFEKAKDDIIKGEDFYYTVQEFGIYSLFYSKMLSIGNDTGTLDEAFLEVATMLESELEEDIERLQKFFEPMLMLILGFIVAIVLASVALPMISILENII